jgi:serine/threonine protein kinase
VLSGLAFLHSVRIMHRDLKPSNALISSEGTVKLADFGLSCTLEEDQSFADSFVGTFNYMSPERMTGNPYSFQSDVWSLGLTIHTVAIGKYPYKASNGYWGLLTAIQDQEPPLPPEHLFSQDFIDFIRLCCAHSPHNRPSADTLLRHSFLQNNCSNTNRTLSLSPSQEYLRNHSKSKKVARYASQTTASKANAWKNSKKTQDPKLTKIGSQSNQLNAIITNNKASSSNAYKNEFLKLSNQHSESNLDNTTESDEGRLIDSANQKAIKSNKPRSGGDKSQAAFIKPNTVKSAQTKRIQRDVERQSLPSLPNAIKPSSSIGTTRKSSITSKSSSKIVKSANISRSSSTSVETANNSSTIRKPSSASPAPTNERISPTLQTKSPDPSLKESTQGQIVDQIAERDLSTAKRRLSTSTLILPMEEIPTIMSEAEVNTIVQSWKNYVVYSIIVSDEKELSTRLNSLRAKFGEITGIDFSNNTGGKSTAVQGSTVGTPFGSGIIRASQLTTTKKSINPTTPSKSQLMPALTPNKLNQTSLKSAGTGRKATTPRKDESSLPVIANSTHKIVPIKEKRVPGSKFGSMLTSSLSIGAVNKFGENFLTNIKNVLNKEKLRVLSMKLGCDEEVLRASFLKAVREINDMVENSISPCQLPKNETNHSWSSKASEEAHLYSDSADGIDFTAQPYSSVPYDDDNQSIQSAESIIDETISKRLSDHLLSEDDYSLSEFEAYNDRASIGDVNDKLVASGDNLRGNVIITKSFNDAELETNYDDEAFEM